jgi:hypothetical protein
MEPTTKETLSMRNRVIVLAAAVLALAAMPVLAGEWHSGQNNLCSDCHTMHFSQQHNWDSGAAPSTTPAPLGNWLGTVGPNDFLLKAPANQLCLACHDGQTFAPDVLGLNTNASPSQGREAGALNDAALGAPYETWKGHTLDSTDVPPGFDPAVIGAAANWYDPAGGLECISCHAQHGPNGAYRNLGPYALGGAATAVRPTYVISNTNNTAMDVWIDLPSYTANSGNAATFNPYYDFATISFNRNDATVGTTQTSNRMDTFCAACHGTFHGGAGDTNIGASAAALDGFIRHPTSAVTLGAAAAQGYGGHSSLSRYVANTTKVHVYASDTVGYTDASPGCISCHKAHGNQNPFGLMFLNGNATAIDEQGGWNATQTQDLIQGYRNLCGQCHSQGNGP